MSEILVVTSPGGKQCTLLLPLLYNKGKFKLRLATHSESTTSRLRAAYPDAEIRQTDLTSESACRSLLHGATAVYHVGPSFHSREEEIGKNMTDAAVVESQRPGNVFKHFVFSSVLGTQHRNLIQHDLKSRIEERLFLSPINWTVMQPTNFLDTFPVAQLAALDKPALEWMWNPIHPNSVIALRDLAEASAKVLNEREKHYLAQYPLCSTLPISDGEIAVVVGKYLGKEVEIKTPTFEGGVDCLLTSLYGDTKSGLFTGNKSEQLGPSAEGDSRPDIVRDRAEKLVLFYNRRGLVGSPNVLRWLLGREPTTVDEWVRSELRR
ncbi:putative nucleoside-diphosphate-sugar epimerase [Whalleya microplaca]|nr:putative nucleoside-diphosphate-sugar epimerase [Whalleya microplaca]